MQFRFGSVTPGDHVVPPSTLCEHSSTSDCWQKYPTSLPTVGVPDDAGPMPTVGWSAATGQGTVGSHEAPSSCVIDIAAHGPSSPPAMVVPVAEFVARIGSTLNCENGDETSDHVTVGVAVVLSKFTL